MRRAILSSLPVEIKTVREEEESRQRDGMDERPRKQEYGGESFVSISLTEMESYYRYTQCCQQLQSEFCRDVCDVSVSFNCGVWGVSMHVSLGEGRCKSKVKWWRFLAFFWLEYSNDPNAAFSLSCGFLFYQPLFLKNIFAHVFSVLLNDHESWYWWFLLKFLAEWVPTIC